MPRFAIQLLTPLLLVAPVADATAKPCRAPSNVSVENLLARAGVAMDIPGTRRVAMDRSGSCLEIDVSTPGTARLVGLLLRVLEVPRQAVRFQVVT